jgi:hypothetical protein
MPKQNKKSESKGKSKKVNAPAAEGDNSFDDLLAEFRAMDLANPVLTNASSNSRNSSTSRSGVEVTEDMLYEAFLRENITQLQLWAKCGVRVTNPNMLCDVVSIGKMKVAQCLVQELGADVNKAGKLSRLTPLGATVQTGNLEMMRCLVMMLGADVNKEDESAYTALFYAVRHVNLNALRCLIKELGADVNRANKDGCTPLYLAAQLGTLEVARCLVDEFGADVNQAAIDGSTPLLIAARKCNHKVVRYLLKHGADAQSTQNIYGTAADHSQSVGAPAEETKYLQARTYCANPSCTNAGLKKCERCLKVYFCGSACIRAHWPAHKAECTAVASKLKAAKGTQTSSS